MDWLLGNRWNFRIVFLLTFLIAGALRVTIAIEGPEEFQYVRQYHAALMARTFHYADHKNGPAWKQEMADATRQKIHEPPITDYLTSIGYQLLDNDALWIPRLITSLFWLISGIFLYLILRRYFDPETSLLSTGIYLFLPYSFSLSLSFQPESLMMAVTLLSILSIIRYHERPKLPRLLAASAAIGFAILVKPFTLFIIVGVYLALGLLRKPLRQLLTDRDSWILAIIALTPFAAYYIHHVLTSPLLGSLSGKMIIPSALLTVDFYLNWIYQLDRVLGFSLLILTLVGTLMFARKEPRALIYGLWLGYLVFGAVFTFMYATHSYYHAFIIPIMAFALAPLIQEVLQAIRKQRRILVTLGFLGVLGFSLALTVKPVISSAKQYDLQPKIQDYRDIGERVKHSQNIIALSENEAETLIYYGWLKAQPWPGAYHLKKEKLGAAGIINLDEFTVKENIASARRRFNADYQASNPEYFVITAIEQLDLQPGLRRFLDSEFTLLESNDRYIIYDLRQEGTSAIHAPHGRQSNEDNSQGG
jgi:branched-subunit amino acid transport protein